MSCPTHCVTVPDGTCRQPIVGMPWPKWPPCQPLPDLPVPPLPVIELGQLKWWLLLGALYFAGKIEDWWNE